MNKLIAWLKSKNVTSHTVAAISISAATLITTDQQARDFVQVLFKAHPSVIPDILLIAGIILKYSHSSSPAGAIVAGGKALDAPNAPTPLQIAAADPTSIKEK
jgi:hypothetical protein